MKVAIGTAEEIQLYVKSTLDNLQGLANNINRIYLNKWQKEVVIRNYVINFDEFRKIYIVDHTGKEIVTSSLDEEALDRSCEEPFKRAIQGEPYFSEVFISDNLLPSMIIALPIKGINTIDGVIVGEIDLSAMWDMVDRIRIGKKGVVFVISRSGLLIAHGDSEKKPDVFKKRNMHDKQIVKSVLQGKSVTMTYMNSDGREMLGIGHPVKLLGWGVIAEQPTSEAFLEATWMTRQLSALIILFLVIMITIGTIGGRRLTKPIYELIDATRAIASGDLTRKVRVCSGDEFEELASSFNLMTERLAKLQEDIRINERLSIFARIAAGLVHDLKHPIKNIENSSNLILRLYNDQEYRELFHKTVQREFSNINRFLDDLHDLTHPTSIALIELNVEAVIKEMINLYRDETSRKGIELRLISQVRDLRISADRFLFERIIKNLMTNAIEAMPKGGTLTMSIALVKDDSTKDGSTKDGSTKDDSPKDGSTKDDSTKDDSTKDDSTKDESTKGDSTTYGMQGSGRMMQKSALIAVEDTGMGIAGERIDTIFTDYLTTKKRGLGLGLAITKKIVSELGGDITVHSEVGKGTVFTLVFPLVTG
jgi:signal transduction histidine kinase